MGCVSPACDSGCRDTALSYGDTSPTEDEEGDCLRKGQLDALWMGLGSLGERLAGVDSLFDQLQQDMEHDREVGAVP